LHFKRKGGTGGWSQKLPFPKKLSNNHMIVGDSFGVLQKEGEPRLQKSKEKHLEAECAWGRGVRLKPVRFTTNRKKASSKVSIVDKEKPVQNPFVGLKVFTNLDKGERWGEKKGLKRINKNLGREVLAND